MTNESYETVECLPECDERHSEGCPALAAEGAYWFRYFGLRSDMSPSARRAQLARFRPMIADNYRVAEPDLEWDDSKDF